MLYESVTLTKEPKTHHIHMKTKMKNLSGKSIFSHYKKANKNQKKENMMNKYVGLLVDVSMSYMGILSLLPLNFSRIE